MDQPIDSFPLLTNLLEGADTQENTEVLEQRSEQSEPSGQSNRSNHSNHSNQSELEQSEQLEPSDGHSILREEYGDVFEKPGNVSHVDMKLKVSPSEETFYEDISETAETEPERKKHSESVPSLKRKGAPNGSKASRKKKKSPPPEQGYEAKAQAKHSSLFPLVKCKKCSSVRKDGFLTMCCKSRICIKCVESHLTSSWSDMGDDKAKWMKVWGKPEVSMEPETLVITQDLDISFLKECVFCREKNSQVLNILQILMGDAPMDTTLERQTINVTFQDDPLVCWHKGCKHVFAKGNTEEVAEHIFSSCEFTVMKCPFAQCSMTTKKEWSHKEFTLVPKLRYSPPKKKVSPSKPSSAFPHLTQLSPLPDWHEQTAIRLHHVTASHLLTCKQAFRCPRCPKMVLGSALNKHVRSWCVAQPKYDALAAKINNLFDQVSRTDIPESAQNRLNKRLAQLAEAVEQVATENSKVTSSSNPEAQQEIEDAMDDTLDVEM